jgi:FkbM family methyltransferase
VSRRSLLSSRGPVSVAVAATQAARGILYRKVLKRNLVPRKVFGFKMLLDLSDAGISRTLLLFGQREMEHRWILERVLRPGMSVLDIGSNIGYYPLMELGLIGPGGTLHAIEPDPRNVELLERNLILNGYLDVPVRQAAVSDASGTAPLFLSGQRNLNTLIDAGAAHLSGKTVEVPTLTLREARGDLVPDLIRMDVEGAEVAVLQGIAEEVSTGKIAPMVLFETHPGRYTDSNDVGRPLRALFDLGYTVRYAGSSWERGTEIVTDRGYSPLAMIRTDDVIRGLFENISGEDLIEIITVTGGIRTVLLSPPE